MSAFNFQHKLVIQTQEVNNKGFSTKMFLTQSLGGSNKTLKQLQDQVTQGLQRKTLTRNF